MGVQLKWQALLTKEQTYLIVLGGILLALAGDLGFMAKDLNKESK